MIIKLQQVHFRTIYRFYNIYFDNLPFMLITNSLGFEMWQLYGVFRRPGLERLNTQTCVSYLKNPYPLSASIQWHDTYIIVSTFALKF